MEAMRDAMHSHKLNVDDISILTEKKLDLSFSAREIKGQTTAVSNGIEKRCNKRFFCA